MPNSKNIFFYGAASLILSLQGAQSSIQKIPSLKDFPSHLLQFVDKDTWIIFDVNRVILTLDDQVLRANGKKFRQFMKKYIYSNNLPHGFRHYESYYYLFSKWRLVEQDMPEFIKKCQQSGASVMALTHAKIGPRGLIPSMTHFRINQLKKFNVNFSLTPPYKKNITLMRENNKPISLYDDGILFSGTLPKGVVLKEFIEKTNLKPKYIIFFDNSQHNLESVRKTAEELNIPFQGYLYTAASLMKGAYNPSLAAFQFDHLLTHEKWLPDSDAIKKLKNSSKEQLKHYQAILNQWENSLISAQ